MRVVLQRVTQASVTVDDKIASKISHGLLILLGIEDVDDSQDVDWLVGKICKMRIFDRPSFIRAARPETAIPLYEKFCASLSKSLCKEVGKGVFGAMMSVNLSNDGPVTIIIDSRNRE